MAQRLKRWESPRREGRNNKGKGGSARQRQLKKQQQMLRKKLKDQGNNNKGREVNSLPFFLSYLGIGGWGDGETWVEFQLKTLSLTQNSKLRTP